MYYYFIALSVFVFDQITKWFVLKQMQLGQTIPLWEDVFHFTSHRNRGAAFGILQNQRWLFILITIIVVIGIVYYMREVAKNKPLLSYALSLILGGAIGNFVDRLWMGEVVDFLDFVLIRFPIFNVADSAICIGVGLFILDAWQDIQREKRGI